MSSDTVISVSNLSKSYRLGTISSRTLREDLSRAWARLLRKPDPLSTISNLPSSPRAEDRNSKIADGRSKIEAGSAQSPNSQLRSPNSHLPSSASPRSAAALFWALRDISFEVKQGEVLGIIGANGAGKSTLLKILSRITAPTHGEVRIKGRIASLLEIGTGFHPDLTGRENIFLNGAIMGMSRGEIRKKSDEIIDFSGVEEFIDSPVKRYSSGMYVRLAFAVAAHLDPDILLLDEVLSVGDIGFQAKCYNKISAFRKQGTAFILVSHNMLQITRFCTNVLYLRKGQVVYLGPTDGGVELFRQEMAAQAQDMTIGNASGIEESGSMAVRIEEPFFANPQGEPVTEISSDEPVCLVMPYRCRNEPVSNPVLELGFRDASREILFHGSNRISAANLGVLQGTGRLVVHFDAIPANNQMLITSIALWNASMQELLYWRRGVKLKVRGHPKATGRILLQCRWSHVRTEKPVRSCESSA